MRCPNCKAYLPFDSKEKKCSACGTVIKKKPFFEDMLNMSAELSADKSFLFWSIVVMVVVCILGAAEFLLSKGLLLDYLEKHIMHSLLLFLFWGMIIEKQVKINVSIRLASRTVIVRERRILRLYRLWSNITFLGGIALAVFWITPEKLAANFPAFTLIAVSFLCLYWALFGLLMQEREFEDHRIRNFFFFLGVHHPHKYRVASAWYLLGIVIASTSYFTLTMFPSIFWGIYNSGFMQSTIKAVNGFLVYIPTI
ncbi:hypothetical protein ISS30_10870 [bacterium]|nr:hypothetical protein [bacterium]